MDFFRASKGEQDQAHSGLALPWGSSYTWVVATLWAALILTVPVTSFPWLAERLGAVTVAPLALLPLVGLLVFWLGPDLLRGGPLPFLVWPLIGFCLVSMLAAGTAWFLPLAPFKGQTVMGRELRALLTLGIGLTFYLAAVRFPTDSRRRRWTLAALYLGGAAALVWGSVQADYVLRGLNNFPQELNEIHRHFSIRDLERNRVTGMAFEPSWFGDQLVVLYLPLWLGGLLTGHSLLGRRWGAFILELPLLVWGSWILLMTRSRVSLGALLLMVAVLLVVGLWRLGGWLYRRLRRTSSGAPGTSVGSKLTRGALALLGIVLAVAAGYTLLVRLAQIDSRMSRALATPSQLPTLKRDFPFTYPYEVADRFAFAERVVYWQASLHPFAQYPVLGVGPGNAGFLFEEGVPSFGYQSGEIRAYLGAATEAFPNPKNLWVRLVSETGFVGFAFYAAWLALLGVAAWRSVGSGQLRWMSAAMLLSLVAQAVEGFSLDSFALPQIWLMNGIFTATFAEHAWSEHREQASSHG